MFQLSNGIDKYNIFLFFLGISLVNNRKLSNLPSNIFKQTKTLKSLRLQGNFKQGSPKSHYTLPLLFSQNLEDLQVIGSASSKLNVPPHFLQNS